MMKFIELFDGFRYKLQNISYNTIESDDEEERELQISYKDSYDIVDSNNDVLVIDFCRKIITSDDILFDLSITYRIEHFVNKELNVDLKNYNVKEEIENNLDIFSGNIMTKVSLLISEITSTFGIFPIITMPIVKIDG